MRMRSVVFRVFSVVFSRLFGTRVAAVIWRIPGAHAFYEWLVPRLRPNVVEVDGHVMHLDPLDSLLLSINGDYEPEERALFEAAIRPGDVVLDVGAHIGLYALTAARAVGPTGRVVAFEPSSANRAILEQNIAENGYRNVEVVAAAVGDEPGKADLALSSGNTGDHSLATGRTSGRPTEAVTVTTIDACAGGPVDVIKMDIQGGEPLALRGASATLAASENVVLFTELSPGHLADHGGTRAYLEALTTAGFDLFEVNGSELAARTVADLDRHVDDPNMHWDLVCVKGKPLSER